MNPKNIVRFRLLAAILVLAAFAPAQLSGTYSIDNTNPTGGSNYATFADAVTALAAGVSGPVVFMVFNGTGPYTGFGIPTAIAGSSVTNTVTFIAAPGNSPVISGPAGTNLQAIKLGTANTASSGPSNITLSGLVVQGAASGAGVLAAGCTNITVTGCVVQNCGAGIYFIQTQNSVIQDCEVTGCGMTAGTPGLATYVGGITLGDSANYDVVQRNRVHDCPANGIFLGGGGSNTAQVWNDVVINNFVWNCPGSGSYPGGIALRRITGSTVSNNSIVMPASSTFNGLHIQASTLAVTPPVGAAAEISNNIVRHLGSGACVGFDVTTAVVPTIFDYNQYEVAGTGPLGKVGTVAYATLASWQALAAPSLVGKELNSIAAPAGFLSATDLHITPGSAAFNSGSTVAAVIVDIDLQPRPIAGIPDRGADETPATGLFASFSATPTTGLASLTVAFTDASYSSDPGGVLTWAWDFQNDGIDDSFVANPAWTYFCPGVYSVKLTVTDASNPASILVRNNLITVGNHRFDLATTGGGVGDLTITPVPTSCGPAAGAATGWTLVSFATTMPVGTGPFLGLIPDAAMFSFLLSPAMPGSIVHFVVAPGLYPDAGQVVLPPGMFSTLSGVTMDAVMVFLTSAGGLKSVTNVDRVTF